MDEERRTTSPIVFGEALVDVFDDALAAGGAPFNVACHLAALGCTPLLITRIGRDAEGGVLRAAAARCGLSLDSAQIDSCTARATVHETRNGAVFEIGDNQAFDRIDADAALRATASGGAVRWLYFGTLALRAPASRAALAALRRRGRHRAFVDLNWRAAGPPAEVILDLLHDIEVLKLNAEELSRLLGWLDLPPVPGPPRPGEEHAAMRALCRHNGARQVLASYGSRGVAVWDAQGRCTALVPAPTPTLVVDTVGAGDALSAMLLAGLLRGCALTQVLELAAAFATASCTWRGALPPSTEPYAVWRAALDAAAR